MSWQLARLNSRYESLIWLEYLTYYVSRAGSFHCLGFFRGVWRYFKSCPDNASENPTASCPATSGNENNPITHITTSHLSSPEMKDKYRQDGQPEKDMHEILDESLAVHSNRGLTSTTSNLLADVDFENLGSVTTTDAETVQCYNPTGQVAVLIRRAAWISPLPSRRYVGSAAQTAGVTHQTAGVTPQTAAVNPQTAGVTHQTAAVRDSVRVPKTRLILGGDRHVVVPGAQESGGQPELTQPAVSVRDEQLQVIRKALGPSRLK